MSATELFIAWGLAFAGYEIAAIFAFYINGR